MIQLAMLACALLIFVPGCVCVVMRKETPHSWCPICRLYVACMRLRMKRL